MRGLNLEGMRGKGSNGEVGGEKGGGDNSFIPVGFGTTPHPGGGRGEAGAGNSGSPSSGNAGRKDPKINVSVAPTAGPECEPPEIRKYKKKFNTPILCATLWGECLCGGCSAFMVVVRVCLWCIYCFIWKCNRS